MEFSLDNSIALLSRTPAALDGLLRGLPEAWTLSNEGPIKPKGKDRPEAGDEESWSPRRVVAHLIYCERLNWTLRTKWILEHADPEVFPPVDLHIQFDQPLDELLTIFAKERAEGLVELRALNLTADDFARLGLHGQFGPVTLSQLLATWTVHDLTHLHQISRVLAHQYREAVGPWSAYLGVLHCEGHGSF
jgi:DinB superfamily